MQNSLIFVERYWRKRRLLRQQRQGRPQHAPLLLAIAGSPERGAATEPCKGRARRRCQARHPRVPTSQRCGDPLEFECAGYQSNGLRAQGSRWHQQRGRGSLGLRDLDDRRNRFVEDARDIGLVA